MTKRTRTITDLLPYLKRHHNAMHPEWEDYTVADGYHIKYQGRTVKGADGRRLSVEEVYGSCESVDTDYIDWNDIEVYKVMKRW